MLFASPLAAAAAALFFGTASAQDAPSSIQSAAVNGTFALRMRAPGDNRFDNKFLSTRPVESTAADMAIISNKPDYNFRFEIANDTQAFDPVQGGPGSLIYESSAFSDGAHNLTAGFIPLAGFNTLSKRQAGKAIPNMLPMTFNAPDQLFTWGTSVMVDGQVMLAGMQESIACAGLRGIQGAGWFKGGSLIGIFNATDAVTGGMPAMGSNCGVVEFYVQLPPQ